MAERIVANRFSELLAVKARREKRRISNRDVARELGLARGTIDAYANNSVKRFDAPTILLLCNYLDCTPGDLLVIEDPEMETPLLPA